MFARFDENPAMTLQDIMETKRYGRTEGQRENSIPTTNKVCGGYKTKHYGRTDGKRENSIPTTNKVCGGYKKEQSDLGLHCLSKGLLKQLSRHFCSR